MAKLFAIQINVLDMKKALDFYCNTLGFGTKPTASVPDIVELEHEDSAHFYFLLCKVPKKSDLIYPAGTQTVITLYTDDLLGMIERLKNRGAHLVYDKPQMFPGGIYTAVQDPFGNVLEYAQPTMLSAK